MKEKYKTEKPENLIEEEDEGYPSYHIDKLVIIAKDNAQITIGDIMIGKPKDPKPPNP